MEFYNYLVKKYGFNEVILSNEISYKDYSAPWIKKSIKKLCDDGKLIRFKRGVYYIPTTTVLGKSKLDPRKVIIRKYIRQGDMTIGYFSGVSFMNALGLSAQMPNTMEIYTNDESARVREIPVGKQKLILRRSRTKINNQNVATMSFLELMNFTDSTFYNNERRKMVKDYINEKGITREMIAKYSKYYPDKAMRTMVESGIIYDVTQ